MIYEFIADWGATVASVVCYSVIYLKIKSNNIQRNDYMDDWLEELRADREAHRAEIAPALQIIAAHAVKIDYLDKQSFKN